MLNLVGMCLAKVNEKLEIESLDVYYNPEEMTRPLTTTLVDATQRAIQDEAADSKVGIGGCRSGDCGVM